MMSDDARREEKIRLQICAYVGVWNQSVRNDLVKISFLSSGMTRSE